MTPAEHLYEQGAAARSAAALLARVPEGIRNHALANIAEALDSEQSDVLAATRPTIGTPKRRGLTTPFSIACC